MNKYHIARRDRQSDGTVYFSLGFGRATFSLQTALEYANCLNSLPETLGTYFAVPAPFAGEI